MVTTKTTSDVSAPNPPGVTTTRVFSSSRIDLYWAGSSSTDLSGYQILRDGSVVGTVALPDRMTFSDTGLSANTTYTYTIRAVDSAGNLSSSKQPPIRYDTGSGHGDRRARSVRPVGHAPRRPVSSGGPIFQTQAVVSCPGCPQATSIDPTPAYQHVVLLAGLAAGTSYAYTVGDGTVTQSGTSGRRRMPGPRSASPRSATSVAGALAKPATRATSPSTARASSRPRRQRLPGGRGSELPDRVQRLRFPASSSSSAGPWQARRSGRPTATRSTTATGPGSPTCRCRTTSAGTAMTGATRTSSSWIPSSRLGPARPSTPSPRLT